MLLRHILFITITAVAPASAAHFKLTIESAAARAISKNPALSAARLRVEEARGRLNNSGRRPNPELEIGIAQNVSSSEHGAGIAWMQKFPRTERLALERAVSRSGLAAAEAEISDYERRLAGEVRAAVVRVLSLKKLQELHKLQIENSSQLSAFLSRRVQAGEVAPVDALQVELELKQLGTSVLQTDLEIATVVGAVRPLLGIRASDTVEFIGELSELGKLPSKNATTTERGDYRAARANAEAATKNVELERANQWEDITAGVSLEYDNNHDAGEGVEREAMVGFKVNLPLPIWNKNEGRIREANAAAVRAKLEVAAVAAQASGEVAVARAEMATLAKILADYEGKLIPQAKQIETQLQTAYDSGHAPLQEVIRARGHRFEIEVKRHEALRDWHLAKVRFGTASGVITGK